MRQSGVETVDDGWNLLMGSEKDAIIKAAHEFEHEHSTECNVSYIESNINKNTPVIILLI